MTIDWTKEEVELIVSDYFSMLEDELNGKTINKSLHRNRLKYVLNKRSDGSIEYKHQNISAVLINLGLPYIRGYKPKWNYQHLLEEITIEYLNKQKEIIEPKFIESADSININKIEIDYSDFLEEPPERQYILNEPNVTYERILIKVNYFQREQQNKVLGCEGEKYILGYEKSYLCKIGKENLAEKVEWVAEYNDSAGFDILSKNLNGTDKYIEVKTTKLGKETPIYFSKNEYEFSKANRNHFHLYRVFNFVVRPKMFTVRGNFDSFCKKEAATYKGYF